VFVEVAVGHDLRRRQGRHQNPIDIIIIITVKDDEL
jgi:hypothetical protein